MSGTRGLGQTNWTFDIYSARHVQGTNLAPSTARTVCNPRVVVEFAGERLAQTTRCNNTRDPVWNDLLRAESRDSIGRSRFPLTFKVMHKPEWASTDTVVSYARIFVSAENLRETRRRLMLKSDVTHDENGGWIEVGWHAQDLAEKRAKEREDEVSAKAKMLQDMQGRTSSPTRGGAVGATASSKLAVGDKIWARSDDYSPWKMGIVQEIGPDGMPKVKIPPEALKSDGDADGKKTGDKDKDKDKDNKDEKGAKGKDSEKDDKDKEKSKDDEKKEAGAKKDDAKDKKSSDGDAKDKEKDAAEKKATAADAGAKTEKEKEEEKKPHAKLLPSYTYPLTHLAQVGALPDNMDAELQDLLAKKNLAVKNENYAEAQAFKEQIEAYKALKQTQRGAWRAEAPVSSLVRACRRIEFESGKAVEAGTIGEVIGGLVRMGTLLFTPTPGDIENYGVAQPGGISAAGLGGGARAENIPVARGPVVSAAGAPAVHHHHAPRGTPAATLRGGGGAAAVPDVAAAFDDGSGLSLVVVPQTERGVEIILKQIYPHHSIGELKQRIQALSGIPASQQALSYQAYDGRKARLEDRRTVASYGIQSGEMILLGRTSGVAHLIVSFEGRYNIRVTVPHNATVLAVKQRIAERENLPVSKQALEAGGVELVDHRAIASYGITTDTPLFVYERHGHGHGGSVAPRSVSAGGGVYVRGGAPPSSMGILDESHVGVVTGGGVGGGVHHGDALPSVARVMQVTIFDETAHPTRSITMDCQYDETVASVKARLVQSAHLPHGFDLLLEEVVLNETYPLLEYGVGHGSVLTAVVRHPRVGSPRVGFGQTPYTPHPPAHPLPASHTPHTNDVGELKMQVSELAHVVEGMSHLIRDAHTPHAPALHPRASAAADVLNQSKALRASAEHELTRISNHLYKLDHPLPGRSVSASAIASPPRTDIVGSDRFQQMKRAAYERGMH